MKKILLSITLLFFALMAFCQDNESKEVKSPQKERTAPKIVFKLKPIRFAEPHSTIVAGVEYKIGEKLSIQNEIGYGFELSREFDEHQRRSFRFNTAIKYYRKKTLNDFYVSLDAAYFKEHYYFSNAKKTEINNNEILFRGIVGLQKIIKRFVFDVYLGGGVKFAMVDRGLDPADLVDGFSLYSEMKGNHTMPALAAGIKLGFLIK